MYTDEKIRAEIAKNVDNIRRSRGIKKADLARALGLTPSATTNMLNARFGLRGAILYQFCVLMGCDITDVLPPLNRSKADTEMEQAMKKAYPNDFKAMAAASRVKAASIQNKSKK